MARLFARIRTIAAALGVGLVLLMTGPAASPAAAQVNPNGSAVQEQQLLNQLKTIQGLGTIPDIKSYVLEHPAGRDWQYFHNVTLRWIAAIAILGFLAVIVIFYLVRGSVKLESGLSGRLECSALVRIKINSANDGTKNRDRVLRPTHYGAVLIVVNLMNTIGFLAMLFDQEHAVVPGYWRWSSHHLLN